MKVTMKCETLRLGVVAYVYVSYKSSYTYEFMEKLSIIISGVDYKGVTHSTKVCEKIENSGKK